MSVLISYMCFLPEGWRQGGEDFLFLCRCFADFNDFQLKFVFCWAPVVPKFRFLIQIKFKIRSARSEVTNRLTHSMADLSWPLKYASVLDRKNNNVHLCLRHSIDRFLYKLGYSSLFVPQAASRAHLSGKREREPWMSSENSFVKSLSSFSPSSFLIGNRVLRMEEGAIIASLPNAPIRAQTDAIFPPVKFSTWLTSEKILPPPPSPTVTLLLCFCRCWKSS